MYKITPGSRENGIIKASLGFNTITHRPLKFRMLEGAVSGITMPTDGLVFYAPLNENSATAATGQSLIEQGNGTLSYQKVNGINCCTFDSTRYIKVDEPGNVFDVGVPKSVSLWFRVTTLQNNESNGKEILLIFQDGCGTSINTGEIQRWSPETSNNGSNYVILTFNFELNIWYNLILVDDGNYCSTYINGTQIQSLPVRNYVKAKEDTEVYIGGHPEIPSYTMIGNMSSVRIYDRALTQEEITLLSREFSSIWSCPRFSSNTREDSTWKVTCGSEWGDNFMCGKVFNGDFVYERDKGWAGANNHPDEWLLIQNKVKPVNVKKIYILPTEDGGGDGFNSFKLYGSNDNSSFDLLYESNDTLRASDGGRYYTFDNKKKYSYYKMTFQCSRYVFLGQIAMFSDTNATIDTPYDYF